MTRRILDAIALNAITAMAYHLLVLACRYVEARQQMARQPTDIDALCHP